MDTLKNRRSIIKYISNNRRTKKSVVYTAYRIIMRVNISFILASKLCIILSFQDSCSIIYCYVHCFTIILGMSSIFSPFYVFFLLGILVHMLV